MVSVRQKISRIDYRNLELWRKIQIFERLGLGFLRFSRDLQKWAENDFRSPLRTSIIYPTQKTALKYFKPFLSFASSKQPHPTPEMRAAIGPYMSGALCVQAVAKLFVVSNATFGAESEYVCFNYVGQSQNAVYSLGKQRLDTDQVRDSILVEHCVGWLQPTILPFLM